MDRHVTGPVLSGGPFAEKFVWVLRRVGVDRVIFGGDYPLDESRPLRRQGAAERGDRLTAAERSPLPKPKLLGGGTSSMALTWGFASSSVMSSDYTA